MAYVIRRIPDGKYVALSGSKNSYTRSLERARVFEARGAALYLLKPGDVPEGASADSYYSRGVAVYR